MTTTNHATPISPESSGEASASDRRLEVLLDEMVAAEPEGVLPEGFAARVAAARPFAPWEVRRARSWRLPAGVGALLVGGSLGLALAPLWTLGPATAVEVWTDLLAAGTVRPVAAVVKALPVVSRGLGKVATQTSPALLATLVAGALIGAAALGRALLPVPGRRGAVDGRDS